MYLTLEVVSPQAASLGAQRRQVVGPKGLTIGRAPGNDWLIPDPYVSKQHARITFSDGRFFVEGLGRNPIAIGTADNAIPSSQPTPLNSGDRLFIDQYEILVTALPGDPPGLVQASRQPGLAPSELAQPVSDDPFADSASSGEAFASDTPVPVTPSETPASHIPDVWHGGVPDPSAETAELDPLAALGPSGARSPQQALPPVNWQQASPLGDHYQPPAPVAPKAPLPQGIPDNWARSILIPRPAIADREPVAPQRPAASPPPVQRRLVGEPAAPVAAPNPAGLRPPAAPQPPARPTPDSAPKRTVATPAPAAGLDLTELLRGAGVSERDLSPEVAQELGKVLRVVIQGVMEVLQARAEIKSQFRLPLTRVQARENNPLKLSPNVESALHTLLVQRNPGYLPTVQAFEDAFADIRNHQMAMLEGVRVAFEAMLSAFEPQELEKEFERTVKRAGLLGGLSGKSRYWELYSERFSRFGRDADDTFRRLFGEFFAEAYERQLERLKTLRSGRDAGV